MLPQLLINGLAMGAIYALVALGFVLVSNAVNVVNFFARGMGYAWRLLCRYRFSRFSHSAHFFAYLIAIAVMILFGWLFFNEPSFIRCATSRSSLL